LLESVSIVGKSECSCLKYHWRPALCIFVTWLWVSSNFQICYTNWKRENFKELKI